MPQLPTAGDRVVPAEEQRLLVVPAVAGNPGPQARVAGEAVAVAADGAHVAVAVSAAEASVAAAAVSQDEGGRFGPPTAPGTLKNSKLRYTENDHVNGNAKSQG